MEVRGHESTGNKQLKCTSLALNQRRMVGHVPNLLWGRFHLLWIRADTQCSYFRAAHSKSPLLFTQCQLLSAPKSQGSFSQWGFTTQNQLTWPKSSPFRKELELRQGKSVTHWVCHLLHTKNPHTFSHYYQKKLLEMVLIAFLVYNAHFGFCWL